MLRILLVLIAALTVWLGLVQPASAVPAQSMPAQAFAYDGNPDDGGQVNITAERGPPATYALDTACSTDGSSSIGGSTRSAVNTIYTYTARNSHMRLAQFDGCGFMALKRAEGDRRAMSAFARSGVAANAGTSLVGKSYGLGTVVENPGLAIKGFQGSKTPGHALNQIINRGVSPSMLRNTVASPKVVLRQGSGNYLHLSDEAAVVLRPDGQVVTAYGRTDFRQHILDILADVG